ncbi:MAG TPA: hypothetical protein VLZ83_15220 [Edaphocola sp.]|nr:hypothetical protein [Edaphocola sp.]
MKTRLKLFFIFFLLVNSNLIFAQSFRYFGFELNTIVTFNDIVNYVEDKSKIITEPSVYTKGEDIKIKDFFDTTTTFGFYKNTQILQAIIITGISEIDYLEHLRKMIFQ